MHYLANLSFPKFTPSAESYGNLVRISRRSTTPGSIPAHQANTDFNGLNMIAKRKGHILCVAFTRTKLKKGDVVWIHQAAVSLPPAALLYTLLDILVKPSTQVCYLLLSLDVSVTGNYRMDQTCLLSDGIPLRKGSGFCLI